MASFLCYTEHMRNTLRRTVTVGLKYPLHTLTIYLTILCLMLTSFLITAWLHSEHFTTVGITIVIWCIIGITACAWLLYKSLEGEL